MRLGILRSSSLVRANLGMMTVFGAYIGFQFVGTLYLQTLHGWSALETALAFLPAGLIVAVGSPRIGPMVDRLRHGAVIAVGALPFVAWLRRCSPRGWTRCRTPAESCRRCC